MSTQPDPATVAAPDANVTTAATNAATDANAHTPDPPVTPPAPHETAPSNSEGGLAELRETVAGLATSMETLTNLVQTKANPDSHPGKNRPWTHWGSKGSEGNES